MKSVAISSIVAVTLVVGTLFMANNSGNNSGSGNNVAIIDGKQVIDLRAKGGYTPKKSQAKAGIPTVLKVSTSGTFDCSLFIRIPTLNISANLPPSGSTEIDLGVPGAGILDGTCGMGMYPFEIDFGG